MILAVQIEIWYMCMNILKEASHKHMWRPHIHAYVLCTQQREYKRTLISIILYV